LFRWREELSSNFVQRRDSNTFVDITDRDRERMMIAANAGKGTATEKRGPEEGRE
jgi:hypothetical protein